eukprot:3626673-Rhodomonas_salina.1
MDTSEGSVVIVLHPEDEDKDDAMMADDEPAAGLRQGRDTDRMPESERDCWPWTGPGLGNGATASRIIQTGTSLTHPGNGEGVFLGE